MVIATHHEGDVLQLAPTLEMTVLGIGDGKVKLGLSMSFAQHLVKHDHPPPSDLGAPESRSATIAVVAAQPDRCPLSEDEGISCDLHEGLITVRGHTSKSYYRSQPGRPPMLVVTCEENQRIRINDVVDIIVLDVHDSHAVRGLICPMPVRYTARRLVERLDEAQGLSVSQTLDALSSQATIPLHH